MLEKIRKIAHHYLFKIFFLVLAVAFAASLGDSSGNKMHEVATVGGQKIELQKFLQIKQEVKKEFANQDLQSEQINKIAIMRLTTQAILEQKTRDLGISVSQEVLADYIRNDSSFHKNGEFDLEVYKKILELNNMSEERLLKSLSNQVASKFLVDSLIVNLPLRGILNDYLYDYLTEKRSISLLDVNTSKLTLSNIKEDELKDYYQKNQGLFQSTEKRSYSYIALSMDEYKKSAEVTDAMVYADYEKNMLEYALPENRSFSHFVAPNQEVANKLSQELKSQKDVELVAKNFAEHQVINENFINQPSTSFLATVDPSLFNLKEGDVTEAVKTDLGWHVFKITKIHPRQYKSFAEVRSEVENNLRQKIAEQQLYELSKKIEDDIASGAEFNDVAISNNLTLSKVQNANGNDPYTVVAFQIGLNEVSEIIKVSEVTLNQDNQDYFIVKVDEIIPSKLLEYSEVKDKIKDIYILQLRRDISSALAKDLRSYYQKKPEGLISNSVLNLVAVKGILKETIDKYKILSPDDIKFSLTSKEIMRPIMGNNSNLSPVFAEELFSLKIGKVSTVQALGEANYGFSIVRGIVIDSEKDKQTYKYVESISDANYRNEIYDQYIEDLGKRYPIEINFELINSIFE